MPRPIPALPPRRHRSYDPADGRRRARLGRHGRGVEGDLREAPKRDGRLLAVGDVWATDRYASANPALGPLASGGSLYLVTVRPADALWLVAVLAKPAFDGEGWSSAANTTTIIDLTARLGALKFTSGKGITAAPGKLGMSLQTPRELIEGRRIARWGAGGGRGRRTRRLRSAGWKRSLVCAGDRPRRARSLHGGNRKTPSCCAARGPRFERLRRRGSSRSLPLHPRTP